MCLTEKCVYVDFKLCVLMHIWAYAYVRYSKTEKEGDKDKMRLLHTGRSDAKSTGWYKSVTTGRSTQSLLQETQIKADLSSQDAVPTSSLDPVAILFLSVLRSVRRGDEAPEFSHSKIQLRGPMSLGSSRALHHCEACEGCLS